MTSKAKIAEIVVPGKEKTFVWLDGSFSPPPVSLEAKKIESMYNELLEMGCPDGVNRFVWAAHEASELSENVRPLVEKMFDSGDIDIP